MHILYIEDNPLDAAQVSAELARSVPPITLERAGTCVEAAVKLKLCTPEQPIYDLVLTGLRLPDGSGLSLLPLIREHRLSIVVVVLVGAGNDDLVVSALKAGATDYVVKRPGYVTRLAAALAAALLRHQAEAARHIRPLNVVYVEHRPNDIGLTRQHFAQFAPHIHLEAENLPGDEVPRRLPPPGECDVLLLDYHLPATNGLELLRALQQTPRRDLPVVLMIEPGHEEIGLQALHLGAMDYVVKHPGYLHKLPMVVENAFERARLVREQAALKASEAYFRSLIENVSDVITVMNADGVVHYQSPSSEAVLGYRPEEVVSADGFRLIHPEDAAVAREAFEAALANPGVASPIGEVRILHKDGSWRVLEGVGKCQVVNDADWKLVVINWHDVTARKQAEEVLRNTKTYVENLVESASAMVIGLDASGAIQTFNQAAERITGYLRPELSGQPRPWLEMLMPRDRYPETWAEYASLAEGAWPRSLECPMLTKAGEERYIAWQTNEIREQGQLVETVLFGMDITERKRAEAKLADTEKRFRALVEHSEDAIALVSVEGDILYQSPAAGRILGVSVADWHGHKIFDLIHPDDLSAYQALLSQLTQKPAGGAHGQCRFRHQDGAWRWIELSASDWLSDSSAQTIVVNYRDVTEGVMRERELAALVTVSRALRTAQNRKELAVVILDQVRALLNSEAAALLLRDPVTGRLALESGSGLAVAPESPAAGEQVSETLLASGRPYVTNDFAADQALAPLGLFEARLPTVAGIPLLAQKQPLGTLWLARQTPIGEAEMRLFASIGNIVANALHRATLHEQTAQYAKQMALATQVGQALAETLDLPKIHTTLGQAVRDLFPDNCGAFISLFDASRNLTTCAYAFADGQVISPGDFPSVSLGLSGKGPQSEAMYTRRPVITDPARSRSQTGFLTGLRHPAGPPQSGLYVPMLAQGQAIGVIQVQSYTPNRFSQTDGEVLLLLGNTAAAAIEKARLYQTTRRQRDELSIVSQVALVTAAREPFDDAVARATEALKLIWPKTSSVGFMFVDQARSELRLHASYLGVPAAGAVPIPLDQGLVGWVVREQKPVRAGNVLADRRYVPITLSTRSQMAAPLVVGGSTIGAINVESPQLDAFSGDDLLLLTTLAEKLSLLFEKSRLEGRLAAHVITLQQQVKDYVTQLETANAELQQAKRETEQADQLRKQFLARLNQALRTPVKTMAGLAQALQGDELAQTQDAGAPMFPEPGAVASN